MKQAPRFDTIVKKLERRDWAELYELRIVLEGFAAEVAAQRMKAQSMTPEDKRTLAGKTDGTTQRRFPAL